MSDYRRPRWREPVFRDAAGAVIEYGSRWGTNSPPDATYSVDTHPERFAPLHLVADALVEHLTDNFEVHLSQGLDHVRDFARYRDFLRVTRVTPADPTAASLTFGFTAYPAVIVHAGLLHDFWFPVCGCDACDDTAVGQVEMLEQHVFAVVAGDYLEAYSPEEELPVSFSLTFAEGSRSGRSLAEGVSPELLAASGKRLRELPGSWTAWPRRRHDQTAARPDGADHSPLGSTIRSETNR